MLIGSIVWIFSIAFGIAAYCWLLKKYRPSFYTANFKGTLIPCSAGVSVVFACYIAYSALQVGEPERISRLFAPALTVVLGFGLLGLADDLYGDRSVGGLRGHLMQLIRHRQLTTGALKAIGGALAALLAGILVYRTNLSNALIGAAIIALSANAVNLTDTRPGRSLAAFFVISLAAVIVGYHQISPSIILTFAPPLITAFFLYLFDRSALLMIGDVGANALGALTGLLWIIIAPEFAQVVFLIFLIWFHWWTESHSLSKVIEQTRWLKRIDRKIGVRG